MAKLCPKCKAVRNNDGSLCQICGQRFQTLEHRVAPYLAFAVLLSLAVLTLALLKC